MPLSFSLKRCIFSGTTAQERFGIALSIAAVAIASLMAPGCSSFHHGSSIHALSSKPPAPAIELTQPAVVYDQGTTTTFPPGKYRTAYEDDKGYYYDAPSKVLVDDVGVYGFDGGIYVDKGKTAPTQWYIVRPNGRRTSGHFKTTPKYKLLP